MLPGHTLASPRTSEVDISWTRRLVCRLQGQTLCGMRSSDLLRKPVWLRGSGLALGSLGPGFKTQRVAILGGWSIDLEAHRTRQPPSSKGRRERASPCVQASWLAGDSTCNRRGFCIDGSQKSIAFLLKVEVDAMSIVDSTSSSK